MSTKVATQYPPPRLQLSHGDSPATPGIKYFCTLALLDQLYDDYLHIPYLVLGRYYTRYCLYYTALPVQAFQAK